MTMGTLAVIGVTSTNLADAHAALAGQGACDLACRPLVGNRQLVVGRFDDEESARQCVVALRRQGWAAAQRPRDDDPHMIAWRNRTQPVTVDEGRLLIVLPWAELAAEPELVLVIDPGGAFGGGTHPTTRLLLEALAMRLQGGETVLDVGCGSGVLALAAVRLGAANAVGIDVEAAAVTATRANAERNGLERQITALATPLEELNGIFDVVLANIGQEVLLALAPNLTRVLAPGGWLGLSGISPAQISRLSAAFPALQAIATPELDDWAAILAAGTNIDTPVPMRYGVARQSNSGE